MTRSRRILNIGHGELEQGQFNVPKEIFGVEGAVPFFRREALESIRILDEITDHDLFWYGEDLDVAWRVHMAGWKQIYDPLVVAWHDRGTSKSHAHGWWFNYISRVNMRQKISIKKRRLEWRNTRWTRIKNDYIINVLRDLPYIVWREIKVLGYTILFEPGVLKELPKFIGGIPLMLKKRREIMRREKVSPAAIHHYFR
jgi:GT2 family glycosyltransferase